MSPPATSIKILLVEDNPKYRQVISKALQREARFELVGPALGSAERALVQLERANSIPPDVILLDLYLPGISGTAAIPSLLSLAPKAKIIVLSQSNREADVVGAIAAGAAGYLLKSSKIQQIKAAIDSVLGGGAPLDAAVAKYIVQHIHTKQPESAGRTLTEREVQVLHLIAQGLVKKGIADQLGITELTVQTHVRRIYEKLGVPNAPAAVDQGHKKGLLNTGH
jgi:DNA-binding NarL/FixJ family response regulator